MWVEEKKKAKVNRKPSLCPPALYSTVSRAERCLRAPQAGAPCRHLSTCSRQQPRGDRRQEVPHTWAHKSQKLLCIVPERGITTQVTPSTYCHQDQAAAELVSGQLWLGGTTPQPHARCLPLCQNPALLLKGTSQRVPMWHPRHDQMSTQTPALQSNPPAHLCCVFFGCLFVFPK